MNITVHIGGGSIGVDAKIFLTFLTTLVILAHRPQSLTGALHKSMCWAIDHPDSMRGYIGSLLFLGILLLCVHAIVWGLFHQSIITASLLALFANEREIFRQAKLS